MISFYLMKIESFNLRFKTMAGFLFCRMKKLLLQRLFSAFNLFGKNDTDLV